MRSVAMYFLGAYLVEQIELPFPKVDMTFLTASKVPRNTSMVINPAPWAIFAALADITRGLPVLRPCRFPAFQNAAVLADPQRVKFLQGWIGLFQKDHACNQLVGMNAFSSMLSSPLFLAM